MSTPNLPATIATPTSWDSDNPADMLFPPMLPYELALGVDTPANVCAAYGITKDEFVVLTANPTFRKAFADVVEELKEEGASFRIKAKMQAESYLETAFKMVQSAGTSDAVRADLIKNTVKWAGLSNDGKDAGTGMPNFQININL